MIKLNDKILEMISGGDNIYDLNPLERAQLRPIVNDNWAVVVCKDENGTLFETEDGTPLLALARIEDFIGNKFSRIDDIPYVVASEVYADDIRVLGHAGDREVFGMLNNPLYHTITI